MAIKRVRKPKTDSPATKSSEYPKYPKDSKAAKPSEHSKPEENASAQGVEERDFNEETTRVLLESKAGMNLTRCENLEELFEDLSI
jgi:hypothetical protein